MNIQTKNRLLPLVLSAVMLTACSANWQKPPAEPIVKTEIHQIPIDVPRRPDAVPPFQITEVPVVVTNVTLPELIERSEQGDLFEHFALSADTWAEIKRQFLAYLAYMKQSEAYFDDIEKQAVEARQNKPENGVGKN